ncbi:MAG: hypothetical protein VB064_11675 [Oscillospiraceae bacterium]|nr:hypothetical protein [Oscillospiraceae bacterium]
MSTEIIETIDEWNDLVKTLKELEYCRWQMQYDIASPEGFHASFMAQDRSIIEIVTTNEAVYRAIVRYKPDHEWTN